MLLVIIGAITLVMAYFGRNVQLSYELAQMLPASDSTFIAYNDFKQRFGEDGNVFVVGVNDPDFYTLSHFSDWYDLGVQIKALDGIEEVVSVARCINLYKNDSIQKFEFKPIFPKKPASQAELDSLKNIVNSLPFYRGMLYNSEKDAYLMAITLDKNKLNNVSRVALVLKIKDIVDHYFASKKIQVHYSGLPYIRTITSEKIKSELLFFIVLSLLISIIILILLFRSARVIFSSLIIVAISLVFTMGFMGLMGFKISILTGIIPSLLVIIAIENCIYLINKYHWEYKIHGNKVKALSRIIKRIGFATLMTNLTTATGFATFIFTSNVMLKEFGIVSSINVMVEYLFSLILIPVIFSFLRPPTQKQLLHLESKRLGFIIDLIKSIVFVRRKIVYVVTVIVVVVCIFGIYRMKTSGKLVDDLKTNDPVYTDLKFFENNFKGVMPFEISIDTRKKNGVLKLSTVKKIQQLEGELDSFPYFSEPLSVAELVKFSKQAYYNGKEEYYKLPTDIEKDFILSYLQVKIKDRKNILHSFLDSTKRYTRISVQMADVGSKEMRMIQEKLKPRIDSIFDPAKFNVVVTGNSVVYTKGTDFLIDNLWESVLIGIVLISIIVAIVFSSWSMVIVAMICNLIPLLLTAAIMGFGGIPVKPSTLIVFSVALGISIDAALLFLSKYRFELKQTGGAIKLSVASSLEETGISMIYTSFVLVLGFAIFILSGFGGTQALGMLISITLFLSLFFNIIVLPSLVVSFDSYITNRAIRKSIIDPYADDKEAPENEKEEEWVTEMEHELNEENKVENPTIQ